MSKRNWIISIGVCSVYILFLLLLVISSISFPVNVPGGQEQAYEDVQAVELKDVTLQEFSDSEDTQLTLPHNFKNLSPRTPVTLSLDVYQSNSQSIYIKSVYAPLKVFANNKLIYEYGQDETYPAFMEDPATGVAIIPLPDEKNITLRMEYLSPASRSVLTVHPVLMGTEHEIMSALFKKMGSSFVFSLILIGLGLIFIIVAAFVITYEKKGIYFFWLGIFAICSGTWEFGECNLSGIFVNYPTLLYIMAFAGLISIPIPLMFFLISIIDFKNKGLVIVISSLVTISTLAALVLQFAGILSLSKSVYFFQLLIPAALLFCSGCLLYEVKFNSNREAKRFLIPVTVLALFSTLELVNYFVRFTQVLGLCFQIGILIFIFITSIVGGMYIRDAINIKNEKIKLEYEVNMLDYQIDEQKKHHRLLVENAEALRRQRHDLKHQLAVINELNEQNKNEELKEYLSSLINDIPSDPHQTYCENIAVNAIVSHYAAIAASKDIELIVKIAVPLHNEQISDTNLCVIFGNLLQNAIEACERMTEGHRFIRLYSRVSHETLVISMDNSFNGMYSARGTKFISSKRNDYGIGLSSITAVAQKSGGDAVFEPDGLVFKSSVYMRI